jgi:hypothetical protein
MLQSFAPWKSAINTRNRIEQFGQEDFDIG